MVNRKKIGDMEVKGDGGRIGERDRRKRRAGKKREG